MQHPINRKIRLAGPAKRLYCRFFARSNPLGWADYHVVEERRGTLWVHCHGLKSRKGFKLEFVGVPTNLRQEAIRLMMGVIRILRDKGRFAPDTDFAGRLSSSRQSLSQVGTFRKSSRSDRDHEGTLRIVDFGEPMQSGFPTKLFAAHLVARGQGQTDAKKAENMFRRAIALFPGEAALAADTADYDPADGDITALQAKSNLGAWLGLALALRAQNRTPEACAAAADAIARCTDWARPYRDHFVQTDGGNDAYLRFWRDLDVIEVAARRPSVMTTPSATDPPGRKSGGFGGRARPVRWV
jgi:hypothetical protein